MLLKGSSSVGVLACVLRVAQRLYAKVPTLQIRVGQVVERSLLILVVQMTLLFLALVCCISWLVGLVWSDSDGAAFEVNSAETGEILLTEVMKDGNGGEALAADLFRDEREASRGSGFIEGGCEFIQ